MWLAKDERRLLEAYYLRIGTVAQDMWFEASGLAPVLTKRRGKFDPSGIPEYGEAEQEARGGESSEEQLKQHIDVCHRIEVANAALHERASYSRPNTRVNTMSSGSPSRLWAMI